MPRWPRVYLSGPITKGDRNRNYHQAIVAHRELLKRRCAVLNPIQTMVLPFAWDGELEHDDWIQADLPWVEAADLVVRLPGASDGANSECRHADLHGILVLFMEGAIQDYTADDWGQIAETASIEQASHSRHNYNASNADLSA